MQKNMGMIDRVARAAVAVVVGGLILTGTVQGIWAILLGLLAVIFIGTSVVSFCPLYKPFGINTDASK
ncbi:MAG: DUF2892 domain-containing protein [Chloroflexaceae bacterium]|nr:DUF2892 domain-containing protein [Chloroflexaceae bacterium]